MSNEEAVQNIKAMFANIPEATIRKTLKQVHFDVDSAVDILLSMDTYELPDDEASSVSTDVAESESSSGGAGGSGDGAASDTNGERGGAASDNGPSTPKLLPKSEAAAALQAALQESVLAAADGDILNSYDEALAHALRQLFV